MLGILPGTECRSKPAPFIPHASVPLQTLPRLPAPVPVRAVRCGKRPRRICGALPRGAARASRRRVPRRGTGPAHSRWRTPRGGLAHTAGRIPDVRPHTPPHSGKRGPPQAIRFFPASGPAAFPGPECSCRRARRPPDHPPFRWKPRAPKAPPPARPAGPRRGKTGGKSGKCGPAPRSRKPRTGGPAGGAARAGVWPPAPAPRLRAPRGKHTAGRGRGGFDAGGAAGERAAAAEGIPGRRAGRGGFAPAPRFGGRQSENNLFKA